MKLIVAGGRDYRLTEEDKDFLDRVHRELRITQVVEGGCTGADTGGNYWAKSVGLPVATFAISREEWSRVGPSAGPKRNHKMAQYATEGGPDTPAALVLFPGGSGTQSMFNVALLFLHIRVFDRRSRLRARWTDEHFGEIAWPETFKVKRGD